MARLGPLFGSQNPPEKVYVGPFFRPFPGNEARNFFSGGRKWGVLGGSQKVYLEKFVCFSVLKNKHHSSGFPYILHGIPSGGTPQPHPIP